MKFYLVFKSDSGVLYAYIIRPGRSFPGLIFVATCLVTTPASSQFTTFFIHFVYYLLVYFSQPTYFIMLQRTILRQRRAVQSAISRSSTLASQSPFRQASPLQQLAQRQPAFRVTVPRFYSTQNDAAKNDANSSKDGEAKEAESPEETFKKELEAKNKEVAEMKVFFFN